MQSPAGFGGEWGYYTDTETGLVLLGHRYYDPGTGRFLNRDPSSYSGGVNLYGFAGDNPVNEIDPSGLNPVSDFFGGASDNINPVKIGEGIWGLGKYLISGHASASALGKGLITGLNPFSAHNPHQAGQRIGGDVMLFVGGIGAVSKLRVLGATGVAAEGAEAAEAAAGASRIVIRGPFRYPNGGWTLLRVDKDDRQIFRIDYHDLPKNGKDAEKIPRFLRGRKMIHWHRRGLGGIGRHRPWESGNGGAVGRF